MLEMLRRLIALGGHTVLIKYDQKDNLYLIDIDTQQFNAYGMELEEALIWATMTFLEMKERKL